MAVKVISGCRCKIRDGIFSVFSPMGRNFCWKGTRCRAARNRVRTGCLSYLGLEPPWNWRPTPTTFRKMTGIDC